LFNYVVSAEQYINIYERRSMNGELRRIKKNGCGTLKKMVVKFKTKCCKILRKMAEILKKMVVKFKKKCL